MANEIVTTGSSNRTVKFPVGPDFRIDDKCLCVNSDFDDPEAAALHIAACILGQTITDANLPRIVKALVLYKERG